MLSSGRSAFLCLGMVLSFWSCASWMPVGGCPHKCTCIASNVDCHGLGLKTVPRDIPRNAERLDLEKNNITRITKTDFTGLKNLRVLHLEENQISVIERGAFQDLKQLERLRLNKNKLQVLPELLFQNTQKLTRLALMQKYKNRKMNYWCWSLDRVPSATVAEMSQGRMKKQLGWFSASIGESGRIEKRCTKYDGWEGNYKPLVFTAAEENTGLLDLDLFAYFNSI